jgi:hypothetical protein
MTRTDGRTLRARSQRLQLLVVWDEHCRGWRVTAGKGGARAREAERHFRGYRPLNPKARAIQLARGYCLRHQPSQLLVQKRNGRIASEWTYGNDPYPPRG